MAYVQHAATQADNQAGADGAGRYEPPAKRLESDDQADEADRGEEESPDIDGRHVVLAGVWHEAGDEIDPQNADRHVDPEDPAPGPIGRDQPTQRRPDHRADQRRHGQIRHRSHQPRLGNETKHHQTPDRHHHGAAYPLNHTGDHQGDHRAAETTQHRARDEDTDGGTKDVTGAELVGHPAADRDEDGETEEIRGDARDSAAAD